MPKEPDFGPLFKPAAKKKVVARKPAAKKTVANPVHKQLGLLRKKVKTLPKASKPARKPVRAKAKPRRITRKAA